MTETPVPAARPPRAWLAPLLAALIALIAGLPGLVALPALDRDESRFAQATAQMLETGDYVRISFLDTPREKKPVGIHWLQAVSVSALSSPEAREIWAYRLPSLLGAMLAAAACAWGATTFWGFRGGLLAGAILGASVLLSTEAGIAKTDAVLCACVTLSMAALARIYARWRSGELAAKAPRLETAALWLGVAFGLLVKGPVAPMVVALGGLALWAMDRRAPWARRLRWGWGLVTVLAVVGPWAMAITVATDGVFWGAAIGGDLAPKLGGGHESHGAPPGLHSLLSPLLLFPATLLLPAAVMAGVRGWREPGVRFALAWLIPTWLVFEILPTKLVHYPLPAYGALAFLAAAAVSRPLGRVSRVIGAVLSVLVGLLFGAVALYAVQTYGDAADWPVALAAAGVCALAGLLGAAALTRREPLPWIGATLAAGVVAHAAIVAGVAPRLEPLWSADRATRALEQADIPTGSVAATGFAEPSLVFALGSGTALTDANGAAAAILDGRPAVVEGAERAAFEAALARAGVSARPAAEIDGFNYSRGDPVRLNLYRGLYPPRNGAPVPAAPVPSANAEPVTP